MLKWNTDKLVTSVEAEIAKRAVLLAEKAGIKYSQMDAMMDIDACHCNGNPLRMGDLLVADEFNFAHDIFGIRANLNRHTGQLENCFVPRFSAS